MTKITHTLKAEQDASEDGTGRGTPIVAIPIDTRNALRTTDKSELNRQGIGVGKDGDPCPTLTDVFTPAIAFTCKDSGADSGEVAPTLRSMEFNDSHANGGGQVAVAFGLSPNNTGAEEIMPTVTQPSISGGGHPATVATRMAVRRLLPTECEILQGFPRGYTAITYHGKPAKDGPRYRAIGNSMATTVMSWLGRRIQMVDEIATNPGQPEIQGKERR